MVQRCCSGPCGLNERKVNEYVSMADEQANSCKKTPCKTPSKPFVSPIRRCEHEDKEQVQRAKRARYGENSKEERTCIFKNTSGTSKDNDDELLSTPTTSLVDKELQELRLILKEKQETLRKLNLVKKYRIKNNLHDLQELINKWRSVSQEGATSLLNSLLSEAGDKPTMIQLLHDLQINHQLIHYSIENEAFW